MAKTIYNVSLTDVIPFNMLSDPNVTALCAAMDTENQFVVNAINRVSVLDNIGGQLSDATDLLAFEQQTPYYDQSLTLDIKRSLVAGTGKLNSIKGTKAAVEQIVQEVFGSGTVQEWYEYGGQPYCFRVLVNDFPNSSAQMAAINRAIAVSQNIRSHLDEVIIIAATTIATGYIVSTFEIAVYINTMMKAPS